MEDSGQLLRKAPSAIFAGGCRRHRAEEIQVVALVHPVNPTVLLARCPDQQADPGQRRRPSPLQPTREAAGQRRRGRPFFAWQPWTGALPGYPLSPARPIQRLAVPSRPTPGMARGGRPKWSIDHPGGPVVGLVDVDELAQWHRAGHRRASSWGGARRSRHIPVSKLLVIPLVKQPVLLRARCCCLNG